MPPVYNTKKPIIKLYMDNYYPMLFCEDKCIDELISIKNRCSIDNRSNPFSNFDLKGEVRNVLNKYNLSFVKIHMAATYSVQFVINDGIKDIFVLLCPFSGKLPRNNNAQF